MGDRALLRPGWRERTCRAGGIDFHLVEAGRIGDPLVVLLHGFPEFWWGWRELITPLAQAGYHVVAPDLRGFNRSTAPAGLSAYMLDVLAADVIALADALGAARFRLVGHDWGGVIGWWVAQHHADRLERVVLLGGPHPDAWMAQVRRHPMQALRSAYIALFQLPRLPEALLGAWNFAGLKAAMRRNARSASLPPAVLDRYAEAWRAGSLTAMLNYYRALRLREASAASPRITPPTLVLWGDRDRYLGRGVMEASAALCVDGRFVVVEGASHWLHWENAERVGAEILAFLEQRTLR